MDQRSVCVVTERKHGEQRTHLYGVFTSEEEARKDYGREEDGWDVEFAVVPLWPSRMSI